MKNIELRGQSGHVWTGIEEESVMIPGKLWLKYYGDIPHSIDYPRVTMYEALIRTVARCPEALAYDFFGTTATYRQFADEIDRCAAALAALGLKPGDRMTIAMPTCPQAVICFYAVNKLGGVASKWSVSPGSRGSAESADPRIHLESVDNR